MKTIIPSAVWIVMGLGLAVLPAASQESRELDDGTRRAIYRPLVGMRVRDPSLTSPVSAPAVDFQLTTESKNKKAKAMVGLRVGSDLFFDVKFIAPLSDEDTGAEPIDLDGLSRDSAVDMGVQFLFWNPRLDTEVARGVNEEYLRRHPQAGGKEGTGRSGPLSIVQLRDEPDLRKKLIEAVEWGRAYFAACRFKVGRRGFSYVDQDFKETSTQKTSRAAAAAAGILTPRSGYFGLNLEYQVFFDEAAAVELVLPFGEGAAQQIKRLVIGPPIRRERFKVQFEYRKTVTDRIALNPKFSYFPRERVALAELPLYLFRDAEEGLNGGVTLSWTSRGEGRFGLGIFIGAAFSLFPQ